MVLEKIRQLYPRFTRSQKKLADFIAVHYREAAFMTASQLAHRLNVNEATVIRFAQRLDYPGYPELCASIQGLIKKELAGMVDPLQISDIENPILQVLVSEGESVRRSAGSFSPELAATVLGAIREAGRIYLLGQGLASHLAALFGRGLETQGYTVHQVRGDPAEMALALSQLTAEDVVIGFSADEDGTAIANALRYAKAQRARTVAFAFSSVSPVAQAADAAIVSPSDNRFLVPSITVLIAYMDALLQVLAEDNLDRVRETRDRVASVHKKLTAS